MSSSPFRRVELGVGGPLGIVGITFAVLSVLAFYGEWWWMLDIAANFRAQLAILGLGVGLGGIALHTRRVVVVGALIVAINLGPIVPLYVGGGGVETEPHLRVASYNLLQSAKDGRSAVVGWLSTLDADVVFLQEATARWASFFENADLPWTVVPPRTSADQPFGTMALVPEDADVSFVDVMFRPSIVVSLDREGETITVLGIHAVSPYGSARATIRDAELSSLADWINQQTDHLIVTGDFNASPFSWSFRGLLDDSGLRNSMDGFGLQPTWPTTNIFLRIPIDHLLYTDGLVIVDRRVADSFGSDHFPLVVDLAVVG